MKTQTASFRVIGIAGQIGSGKTSLARELCKRLNAQKVSFGEFVCSEAIRRNIRPDRPALQELGEKLISELGAHNFVRQVLDTVDVHSIMVLDGVRHIEIWQAICSIAPESILIYLDVPETTRINRLKNRDNLDDDTLGKAMSHPMEVNIPLLKNLASIVFYESPLDDMLSEVLSGI
jgi:cytidylate kinase